MPPTNLSLARQVDAACDRFEAAWRAGKGPRIEDHLGRAAGVDRTDLLRALLAVEVELRRAAGEAVSSRLYLQRFPDDADAISSALAEPGRIRAAGETSVSRESVRTGQFEAPTDATAAPVDIPLPARIGRFAVTGVLGAGAFGRVYRATDPQLGRDVAVKVPLAAAIGTPADRERFLREARAAAGLHHPNICPVHEVGEEAGHPYIVMGFVPGQSLAAVLKARKEPMAPRQAALVARKLALALDAAHKKGVVHRDLKPANVMFDRERRDVVVTDFGLARAPCLEDAQVTRDGVLMGTPAYMSPEQARGDTKAVGPASDQFALGVLLYELLTGRRPFTGSVTEVFGQILHIQPPCPATLRPNLDPKLAAVCLKAMAKDPAGRYESMRQLADALAGFAADAPAVAATVSAKTDKVATETQRIADVFALTERAVDHAIRKHRTPTWMKVGAGLLLVLAVAIPSVVFFTRSDKVKVDLTVVLKDLDPTDKSLTFFLDEEPVSAETLMKPVELKPGRHVFTVKRGKDIVKRVLFRVTGGKEPGIRVEDITPKDPPPPVEPEKSPELKPSSLDRLKAEDIPDRLMAAAFGDRTNAPKELVAIYDSIVIDHKDLNENYFGGFALDKNGGTLASSRYPYTIVELHNLATGRNFNTIASEPGGWIGWLRIAPDNQSIYYQRRSDKLVGCGIGGKIRWQQAVRAENFSVPALSPDGTTLIAADKDPNENALNVFDAETGAIRATWRGLIDMPLCRLAFSPDGKTLAVQSGGIIKFVSAKDGTVLPVAAVERTSGEPRFSPDGKRIYYSVSWRQPEDYCVEVDLASGKRTEYRLPPTGCREIMPNPVLPILATNDSASHLHFWDTKLGPDQQPHVISTGAKIERMLFTPEGRYLVVGAHNLIMIFRLPVERRVSEWAKVTKK